MKFIIKTLISLGFLIFASFATSCDTTNPPSSQKLTLTAEDASCTETWLNLKTKNIALPTEIKLMQNDSIVSVSNINSNDTTLFIENLLPSQTYTFQTIIQSNNQKSNSVSVTTMDTTSHNFTWQTYTFGGANGSSVLNDVAIINENDIWAVGEIHTKDTDQFDSNGVWAQPYNAVHWDGGSWELKRILVNFRGNMTFIPLEGIFAFASNDIWLVGSLPIHGDGNNWKIYDVREITSSNLSLSKAWGMSSNDIYFVGRGGSIAHYNGSTWTKIESPTGVNSTDLNINDIWGSYNNKTGTWEILAVASNGFSKTLLEIQGNSVTILSDSELANDIEGIWFIPNKKYYIVGAGIHYKHSIEDNIWSHYSPGAVTNYLSGGVRGSDVNNVFVTGSFFEIVHFNGVSWHNYSDVIPFNSNGAVGGLDVKKKLFVTVGRNGQYAMVITGKQN